MTSPKRSDGAELVGIDVGGTFTDFVLLVDGRMVVRKEATTPDDQSRAVGAGLLALGVADDAFVAHGTTTATNALLERRGARCALITTAGFRDVLAIGRQNRPHLYRLSQERPPPLIADDLRYDVAERIGPSGDILRPLDEDAVRRIAADLRERSIESVAIVFLFSFRNSAHERRAAELLRDVLPDVSISLSSDILPEYREYERTTTTVINAYVQPVIARYFSRIQDIVAPRRTRAMQSNGGTIGIEAASRLAARLVLSGPAGGVVGAFELARLAEEGDHGASQRTGAVGSGGLGSGGLGSGGPGSGGLGSGGLGTPPRARPARQRSEPRVITFDMGGTSTDVALCDGSIGRTSEGEIAGLPMRLPTVDIHTVGAGGGSIARIDRAGVLRVGPESAGADPGPACYGLGGSDATVTDANVVLGRIQPEFFLGGNASTALDVRAAFDVLSDLGIRMSLSPEEAALGVVRVANAAMERALRRVSVERGHDPREFMLVPFGGAGPLHGCELAEALGIRRIFLPPNPGVLSALGLIVADVVFDTSAAAHRPLPCRDPESLSALLEQEAEAARRMLEDDGHREIRIETFADVRYRGQSYELEVPIDRPLSSLALDAVGARFHEAHRKRYGHAMPDEGVEIVTVRARATAPGRLAGAHATDDALLPGVSSEALAGHVHVWTSDSGPIDAPCYDRAHLQQGQTFEGPALVFQYDTTIYISQGWHAKVDRQRNLCLHRR